MQWFVASVPKALRLAVNRLGGAIRQKHNDNRRSS